MRDAVTSGYGFWRTHGARVRRARVLCQCADGVRTRCPPGWKPRSDRLYRRAARTLSGLGSTELIDAGGQQDADWAGRAHRALHVVQAPYRALALGLGGIGASLLTAASLLVLVGCLVSPAFRVRCFPRDLAQGRPWKSSSADPGRPTTGIGPSTSGNIFFHTLSTDHPWLQIDLGEAHLIRSIRVANRTDCCQVRALPLNFEVFDGHLWQLVAQRHSPFSVWKADVRPVRARLVRVRLAGTGYLHLKAIAVYGQ